MSRSPTFICGKHSIPAKWLLRALKMFATIVHDLKFDDKDDSITPEQRVNGFTMIMSIIKLPHMKLQIQALRNADTQEPRLSTASPPPLVKLSDILEMLQECEDIQATDRRDYVYGLLGLITHWITKSARIRPDYSKTVHQVYHDTASSLLQSGYNNLLRLAVSQKGRMDVPSWVPDFSARNKFPRVAARANNGAFFYALNEDQERPTLELKGHVLGPIEAFDTIVPGTDDRKRYGRHVDHVTDSDVDSFLRKVARIIAHQRKTMDDPQSDVPAVVLAMQRYMEIIDETTEREEPFEALERLTRERLQEGSNTSAQPQATGDVPKPCSDLESQENSSVSEDSGAESTSSQANPTSAEYDLAHDPSRVAYTDERLVCAGMMGESSLFLCQGRHWGAASDAVKTGDVVARLEIDIGILYVLRPLKGETFELVSMAAVPSMVNFGAKMQEPMRSIRLV